MGAADLAAPGGSLKVLPGGLEAETAVIELAAWPGLEKWRQPAATGPGERLAGARSLTLLAVAESGAVPERLGLGAWEVAIGKTVLDSGLIIADDLGDRDPSVLAALRQWAAAHPARRPAGLRKIVGVGTFNRELLIRHGYGGRAFVTSPELGHTVALQAAWWTAARVVGRWRQGKHGVPYWQEGLWSGGWSFGLAGLGNFGEREVRRQRGLHVDRTWIPVSPHYPRVYAKAVGRVGTMVGFASCGFKRTRRARLGSSSASGSRMPSPARCGPTAVASWI